MAAAILIATKIWRVGKMVNVEELDPLPFLKLLDQMGLPTYVREQGHDQRLCF